MKLLTIVLAASLLASPAAFALSVDDQTMASSSKSANFSDPDDKTPVYMNDKGGTTGATDQSKVIYEYDPATGTYVPATAASQK